jgi:hypothetical protein
VRNQKPKPLNPKQNSKTRKGTLVKRDYQIANPFHLNPKP